MVETIEFYEDEEEGLPAPMTRGDVLILNKAQQDADADGAAAPPTADGGTVRPCCMPSAVCGEPDLPSKQSC